MRITTLSLAGAGIIALTAWNFALAQSAETPAAPSKPMETLDGLFKKDYAKALKTMTNRVQQTGLIVVDGPDLVLYLNGRLIDRAATNTPSAYQDLKTIDHIPLAVFVLLLSEVDMPSISAATRSAVERYIIALEAISPSITVERFPGPKSLTRQRSILKASLRILRRTLEANEILKQDLVRFARSQRSAIEANVTGAADAQLRSVDETIRHWRTTELTTRQWDSITVVILGAATAHRRELHLQYFSEVMGVPQQGTDRLLYYEGFDLEGALDLLGRYQLDGQASVAFFDQPGSLFTDVLAHATRNWITEHREEINSVSPIEERAAEGSDER